ncbi:MAG TPA: ABC transporter substrate-binding protein [Candidatus Dormibacteraeota bacterium]|jgi:peptide/nickel transport system substrate-binding protein|nr:ABC transporter substrate-binding protein [Candidatus Dormibacteraeota bacterium]
MNRRALRGLVGIAALLVAVGCNSTTTTTASGGKPLIAEGTTGVTFSEDFNPYDQNSVAAAMNTRSMVNEPLIEFDQLDATAAGTHPWLATAYAFQNGGKDLQVTIRQNVKFSDGSAFGPADVAATFKMLQNPKANTRGVPTQASDPTVSGNNVTLHFNSAQFTGLFNILSNTFILKASMANQIATDPTMTIKVPLGTGPFMLASYTSSLIKFKPNPNYWGGTPPESEIDIPSIATNAAASDALVSGQLDWAGNDIPNVYANYVNQNPLTNHAWFAAGSTVTLWFNLNPGNGGATGIGEVAVRKAISYAIDRNALALLGESGYENAASSSSGLILPNQNAFLPTDGTMKNDLSTSGNVPDAAAAKAANLPAGMDVYDILKSGGWAPPATSRYDSGTGTFKSGGNCDGTNTANCWTKGGQIIKFSVYDPVPFSDYWENAALISQELQPLGIDATTKPAQGYSDWNTNITSNPSAWQTAIHWGNGGSIPYIQFQNWFDSKDANSVAHFQGWSSADADAALRKYESTDPGDTATLYPIVQQLEKIMSSEVPDAPLLYGADWNVFSSAKYTGWPNQSHPYMNPSPSDPQMPYILMQLKPVS